MNAREQVGAGNADIRGVFAAGRDDHPRQAVQHIIQAAMSASGDQLADDATALCLDWHGGPPRQRATDSGANVSTVHGGGEHRRFR